MGSQTDIRALADDEGPRESRKSSRETRPKPTPKAETELRGRIVNCFERVAEYLELRDDDELAEVFREEAAVMAAGLVSLTRPFKTVRAVVNVLVNIVEPMLAFQRVIRVCVERWIARRTRAAQEAEQYVPVDTSAPAPVQ